MHYMCLTTSIRFNKNSIEKNNFMMKPCLIMVSVLKHSFNFMLIDLYYIKLVLGTQQQF